jgi:DNA replication protein DnaC
MTAHAEIIPSVVDRIKRSLVGLKMPRAIEILDATVRRIERGEMNALEAIDALLAEELTLRENRRVKMALVMARLSAIKTLAGFDFSFQPSLDRNRIMALAELQFIDRAEALHLIGPPGTGKSHLSLALGVEAVKAGRSVYSAASPISSAPSPRQNAREFCVRKSSSSAASPCSSSTRSATSQSCQAAAISSFSSSTPVTKRAP